MADEPLRADIEAAKNNMPKSIGSGREIKKLHEHLWEGETVERMMGGAYGSGVGLLVLTDRRVLFLNHGIMSQQSEDFPMDKISSIQWSAGMLLGMVTIFASGNKAEIKNVDKAAGKLLVDVVRSRIGAQPAAAAAAPPAPVVSGSDAIIEQIRKLGELNQAGILTDAEFNAKKTELMNRL